MSAAVLLLSAATRAGAQQPQAPATLPPAPAALSVPNPLAGFDRGGRDLYQSPDGSDRFQRRSQYPVSHCRRLSFHLGAISRPVLSVLASSGDYVTLLPRSRCIPYAAVWCSKQSPMPLKVFVDGFYVGIAEEFGLRGRPMIVTAGAHRVELRAAGYETLTFSVSDRPGRRFSATAATCSSSSTRPAGRLRAAAAGSGEKPLYVIPKLLRGRQAANRRAATRGAIERISRLTNS